MKNLIKYCTVVLAVLISVTLFGRTRTQNQMKGFIGKSYCENDVLIVYADSQDKLTKGLKLCEDPTSIHLKLSPDEIYQFVDLQKFTGVRILTIEFPVNTENNTILDGGINSTKLIDCSFLSGMSDLEFLVIDWFGGVKNIDVITSLENLIYAKLPVEAFHPSLLSETSNVFQYQFGDHFVLLKDDTKNNIEVPESDYESYLNLSNQTIKKFRKKIRKITEKEKLHWDTEPILVLSGEDTLFYATNRLLDTVFWQFNFPENKGVCKGSYSANASTIQTSYLAYERFIKFNNKDEYSLQIKIRNFGNNAYYKKEKEVGYKGAKPHGVFTEYLFGQLEYKKIYNDGYLEYSCYGVNSTPNFNLGSPIDLQIDRINAHMIELYFEWNDTVLIRLYQGRKEDKLLQKLLELPFKNKRANGEVILLYPNGDTATVAEFCEGKLHGNYYSRHTSYGDTIIERAEYQYGYLNGDVTKTGGKFTTIEKYENGKLLYRLVTQRDTKSKVNEMIWLPEQNYSETTFWSEANEIIRVLRKKEDGTVLYDREYPERITDKEIDYRP